MLVKITDIKVRKRVRKDLGDLEPLKDSLRTYGLLNPITLSAKYELIAGERRLEAAKAIGWETINAVVLGRTVDELGKLEMELEENNQRKEFTQDELLDGYHRLERLRNPTLLMRLWAWLKHLWEKIASFFAGGKKKPKESGTKPPAAPAGTPPASPPDAPAAKQEQA